MECAKIGYRFDTRKCAIAASTSARSRRRHRREMRSISALSVRMNDTHSIRLESSLHSSVHSNTHTQAFVCVSCQSVAINDFSLLCPFSLLY